MAEKLANLSGASSSGGLTKANGNTSADKWNNAYSNAKSVVIAVFRHAISNYENIINVTIPISEVTATTRYFLNGTYYNSSQTYQAQVRVTTAGFGSEGMYANGASVTYTVDYYYD